MAWGPATTAIVESLFNFKLKEFKAAKKGAQSQIVILIMGGSKEPQVLLITLRASTRQGDIVCTLHQQVVKRTNGGKELIAEIH